MVTGVGQQLDEGDAEVGRALLLPAGKDHRQPVQHQPAEAGVILGQVIDGRVGRRRGRGIGHGRVAVEVAGTPDLERELDVRQHRVESHRRAREVDPYISCPLLRLGDVDQHVVIGHHFSCRFCQRCRQIQLQLTTPVRAVVERAKRLKEYARAGADLDGALMDLAQAQQLHQAIGRRRHGGLTQ